MRIPSTGNASLPDDEGQKSDRTGETDKARAKPARSGTATKANVKGRPAPRLPHERDESPDSGTGAPSEVMRRAHDDVASGKQGSDKGEASDAVYRRHLRGRTPGAERD